MPLSIRNAKVEKLARQRAAEHNMSVTAVIGEALHAMPPAQKESFGEFAEKLAANLAKHSKGKGRRLTKDETNAEWMD